jgi:predicted amino acid-binding ACT domain protein
MMNQKEAVFAAVTSVLAETGVEVEGDVSQHMTKERRSQVNTILFEGFRSGKVSLDREFTDSELKAYVSGLQSNWLRKDTRLNGGVQYVPKNPGSRMGSGDAQLKALKALLKIKTEPSEVAEIQRFIERRQSEIGSERAKQVTINVDDLPAELRAKLGV